MKRSIGLKVNLFVFFIVSIFIDSINGYLQVQKGIHTSIGVVFRIFVLLLLFPSIKKNKNLRFLLPILPFLLLAVLYWNIGFDCSIIGEIDILIRIVYIFLFINYFYINWNMFDTKILMNYISNYGFIIALIIFICFCFNIGNHSYGEDYGFGNKGFFKAGNDLGLTLIFTLVFSFLYYLNYVPNLYSIGRSLFIALGGVLVGARASLIVSIVLTAGFLGYLLFVFYRKYRKFFSRVFLLLLVSLLIPRLYHYVYDKFDNYAMNRFTLESMQNARSSLTDAAILQIGSFDGVSLIIGNGAQSLFRHVADVVKFKKGDEKVVEADIFEFIGSYGFILGGVFLYFFYYICWRAFKRWLNDKTITNSMLLALSLLFVIIGALAGHAIKNPMVAPVYGVMCAMILQRKTIK